MRAVIVKTSAMGDVAQALKVAEYLKVRQNAEVVGWVAEESIISLVQSYHYIDIAIPINSKKIRNPSAFQGIIKEWKAQKAAIALAGEWDVVFDLQGNLKSSLVDLCLTAKHKVGYGWKTAPEKCNLLFTTDRFNPPSNLTMRDEYLWMVQSFFHDQESYIPQPSIPLRLTPEQHKIVENEIKRWSVDGKKSVWIISPGSRWTNKTCSSTSMLHILQMVAQRSANFFFVFVAGSCEELKEIGYFASHFISSSVVLFQPELPVLSHLMIHADRVLAMDSLVLHLASLTNTPTFSFYGPSSGLKYAPMREFDGMFQGSCPYGEHFIKRCRSLKSCVSGACLKDASGEKMAEAIINWDNRLHNTNHSSKNFS